MTFINIYAPSGNDLKQCRRTFFGETLMRNLSHRKNRPILIGDFNCVLKELDTEANFLQKKSNELKDIVEIFCYSDAYRVLHPEKVEFSFYRPNCAASRLDRVYIPSHMSSKLASVQYRATLSDHKMLKVEIDIGVSQCEKNETENVWKMNTSILENSDFMENFSFFFKELEKYQEVYTDICEWWDLLVKPRIRIFCQKFGK